MKILVVGAGVIGTVYGAQLAASGHAVSVLRHGARTDDIAHNGLTARDAATGVEASEVASVISDLSEDTYDLIVVAVRRDQIRAACERLRGAAGSPCLLFLGNNPDGRAAVPIDLPGTTCPGFPGIGGTLADGVATYLRIAQQPTTIEASAHPAVAEFADTMMRRGFAVTRTPDMDGWLAYHATFVACVAAALYRCGTDATRVAADRPTLALMCRAITEGFAAQKAAGRTGLPRNLAILHHPLLRPIAVGYWAHELRSPMGELCFAAHARHARSEMLTLADDVLTGVGSRPHTEHLRRLLNPADIIGDGRSAAGR
jgi:2-dehydropantoate 2-reductase